MSSASLFGLSDSECKNESSCRSFEPPQVPAAANEPDIRGCESAS